MLMSASWEGRPQKDLVVLCLTSLKAFLAASCDLKATGPFTPFSSIGCDIDAEVSILECKGEGSVLQ